MSDTPRTDEQINGKPCTRFEILAGDSLRNALVPSEFARELERELNAANVEIEEKRKDVVWLATEKAKLEERIKRLEEAGDALCAAAAFMGWHMEIEKWNKAKEAKL
jgi:predicted  nucleic acid-binding Zn-ribbon protein